MMRSSRRQDIETPYAGNQTSTTTSGGSDGWRAERPSPCGNLAWTSARGTSASACGALNSSWPSAASWSPAKVPPLVPQVRHRIRQTVSTPACDSRVHFAQTGCSSRPRRPPALFRPWHLDDDFPIGMLNTVSIRCRGRFSPLASAYRLLRRARRHQLERRVATQPSIR